jgi:hypothetical protein
MAWWPPSEWRIFKEPYPDQYERKPLTKPIGDIPPGSVVLCSSNKFDFISWVIRKVTRARVSHAMTYWGSGCHETVEAEPKGIRKDTLDKRINSHDMLWIWRYKPLTVEQLMLMKGYSYGSVGKPYDFEAFVDFALGGGHPTESKAICSENVVRTLEMASIKVGTKTADKMSPGALDEWFKSHPEWELWAVQNVKV